MAFVLLLLPGAEHAVLAQQQVRGGFRPVFGGGYTQAGEPQPINADFSLTASEAYDNNLVAGAGATTPSAFENSGAYTTLAPQFDFSLNGQRTQFIATGTSTGRYYPQLHRAISMGTNIGAGVSTRIGRSTTLSVNEGASYAPASLYGLLESKLAPAIGTAPPITADYQTTSERAYTTTTAVRLTREFSDRASLELSGDYGYSMFVGNAPGYFNMPSADAGGRWLYTLSRDLKLRVGYTYRHVQYSKLLRPVEHDLQIGLDYTRPLSATRKTTMGFSVTPTLIAGQFTSRNLSAGSQYRMTGDAFLEREIGRTWHARAAYNRGIAYIQGLAGPVYNDSANIETGGFLNQRMDVTFSAAYALGEMAAQASGSGHFTTYSGDARLRYGLTRRWALFAEALLYDYTFDENLIVVPGLPHHFSRDSVQAGLILWFPMRAR